MGLLTDQQGSSPRVRSGHRMPRRPKRPAGIISACAERTERALSLVVAVRDHLRVCGADEDGYLMFTEPQGSSPRVRSGQLYFTVVWAGRVSRNI